MRKIILTLSIILTLFFIISIPGTLASWREFNPENLIVYIGPILLIVSTFLWLLYFRKEDNQIDKFQTIIRYIVIAIGILIIILFVYMIYTGPSIRLL